jgi:hypothetical protein
MLINIDIISLFYDNKFTGLGKVYISIASNCLYYYNGALDK